MISKHPVRISWGSCHFSCCSPYKHPSRKWNKRCYNRRFRHKLNKLAREEMIHDED